MSNLPAIEPGWVELPADEYHGLRAVSSGLLNAYRASPLHGAHYMKREDRSTEAQEIGTATHLAILEPDLFPSRVLMEPVNPDGSDMDRRTKAYKEARAAAEQANPGALILKPFDYRLVLALRDAVHASDEPDAVEAREILARCDRREATALWVDAETRLLCKARFDAFGAGIAADLKTARNAGRYGFAAEAAKSGYPIQRAWYERAAEEMGEPVADFPYIVVSKAYPIHVQVYRFDAEWMAWAHGEARRLLDLHAECVRTNRWPAPRGGVLAAPRWLLNGSEAPEDGAETQEEWTL